MKFMNLKRFGATVMAGVMALSLAVPAFASSTVIDGSYNPITLAVTVPKTAKAIINPYGLPYNLDENTVVKGDEAGITTGSALLIENRSKTALKVSGTVTAAVKDDSDVTFITTGTPTENAAKKEVLVNVELFEALGVTEANYSDLETTINPKFAALKTANAVAKAVADPASATGVALTNVGDGLILRECNAEGELQNGGAGFFRLSGLATKAPTADSAWDKTDGFTVTVAFTFTPGTFAGKSAGTLNGPTDLVMTGASQKTSGNMTFTSALPTGVKANSTVYASSDTSVLTVNEKSGAVTALKDGSADVTITIEGSDGMLYTAKATVTVAAS